MLPWSNILVVRVQARLAEGIQALRSHHAAHRCVHAAHTTQLRQKECRPEEAHCLHALRKVSDSSQSKQGKQSTHCLGSPLKRQVHVSYTLKRQVQASYTLKKQVQVSYTLKRQSKRPTHKIAFLPFKVARSKYNGLLIRIMLSVGLV